MVNSSKITEFKDVYAKAKRKSKTGLILFFILWTPYLTAIIAKAWFDTPHLMGIDQWVWLSFGFVTVLIVFPMLLLPITKLKCPSCDQKIGDNAKQTSCKSCGQEFE